MEKLDTKISKLDTINKNNFELILSKNIEPNLDEKKTLNYFLMGLIDIENMNFIKKHSNLFKRVILDNEYKLNDDMFLFYDASHQMVVYMSSLMDITVMEFCTKFFVQLHIEAYAKLIPFYISGLTVNDIPLDLFDHEIILYFGEPDSNIYDNLLNGKIPNSKHETIINILYDCCASSVEFKTFLKSYISTLNDNFHFLIHLLEILICKEISNDEKSKLLGFFSTDYAEFNKCLQDYIDIN